ncbi:hypothetical protein [Thermoactinospora rubra]|uniref:hypothetical protein n=1 Tax=Thermoactinospora rubra TaxID=1088767 RepID=UPI000A0FA262|nr:hypothetical protein [Thermoactinospora rubra]
MKIKIGLAAAALVLAGLTTGCGAFGQAVDCNAVSKEVTEIMSAYSTSLTASMSDPQKAAEAMEKSGKEAADKLRALAAKHDGELAAAVNDLAGAMDGMKVDAANPSGMNDAMAKVQSFQTKIISACS